MKLQITDSDALSSLNSRSVSIDKEVLTKLLDKPMLIQSLTMKSNQLTQLKLVPTQSSDSSPKTSNIPRTLLLELSQPTLMKLLNANQEIMLSRVGNTIQLRTNEQVSGQLQTFNQQIGSLTFSKAVAVDNDTLLLANLINKNEGTGRGDLLANRPQIANASLRNTGSVNHPKSNQAQFVPTNQQSSGATKNTPNQPTENTQQLISQALKSIIKNDAATANTSIAKYFNQLNKDTHTLVQRLLGFTSNNLPSNAANNTANNAIQNLKLNDSVTLLKELVQSNYLPLNSKLEAGLKTLLNLLNSIQRLQAIANPADKKASVSIQNRLLQSGNFMESKLAKATISSAANQSTNPTINRNDSAGINRARSKPNVILNQPQATQTQDLKLIVKDFYQHTQQLGKFLEQGNRLTPLILKLAQNFLILNAANQNIPGGSASTSQNSGLVTPMISQQFILELPASNTKPVQSNVSSPHQTTQFVSAQVNSASNLNFSPRTVELVTHYLNWLQTKPSQSKAKINNNQVLDVQNYKEILGNLNKSSESMLHRIETNQLLSARAANMGLVQYLVDLPIHHNSHIDSFEMLFDGSDPKKNLKSSGQWKVTIRFELEPLGPVFARVSLNNERITTDFYAKEKSTSDLINQHLDKLHNSLLGAGLDIDRLEGQQGLVPDHLAADELEKATKEKVDIRI